MSERLDHIPIFPLQTVLVPGGFLPLKIFEQRYLDMVRDCVRDESGFGVCLILEGSESGQPAQHARIGTLARIRDWHTLESGLLGITAQGGDRFRIERTTMRDSGLMMADIQVLPEQPGTPIPDAQHLLSEIVARFMDKLEANYPGFERSLLEDAGWVGYRLTELLPIRNLERQALLEMDDPLERLQALLRILPRFQ
ncbi:MAG: LON peptidase substrate-binding domain-containing protein [Xanthomonadales bacterium]|nr:LON peptidase substrate-binding domain-containing protein [Xanthomonadales bacterium]